MASGLKPPSAARVRLAIRRFGEKPTDFADFRLMEESGFVVKQGAVVLSHSLRPGRKTDPAWDYTGSLDLTRGHQDTRWERPLPELPEEPKVRHGELISSSISKSDGLKARPGL